jgi:hypothetical protein
MRRTITKRTRRMCETLNHTARCHEVASGQTEAAPKHRRARGIALVWTALVIFAIFLLVGLSIDTAKLAYNLHELQNAADAAALAGAQIVKFRPAEVTRELTHNLAYANTAEKLEVTLRTTAQAEPFEDNPNLDIILGRWVNHLRYFFPTLDTPDAVKVIARRAEGLESEGAPALAMLYGPLCGVDTADANRMAIGWYADISGAGLIVLDPDASPGLYIAGTGDVRVIGGSIHVNSIYEGDKSGAALYVQGDGNMLCGRLTLQGTTDPYSDEVGLWEDIWTDELTGIRMPYDIFEDAPYMPDPLRDIVPPDINDYVVRSYNESTDGSAALSEGYYPDGIKVTADGTHVTLNPGTYILGGGNPPGGTINGLIQNGGTLVGHGVLIYLTKDYTKPDGKWAQLDLGGNVITDITPPGDESTPKVIDGLEGVSIWQDRANTANTASLHGGSGMMISGTLYFPNNHVYLAGTPGKAGNQIICGSVEVHGNAPIVVQYDGRNNQHKGRSVLVK